MAMMQRPSQGQGLEQGQKQANTPEQSPNPLENAKGAGISRDDLPRAAAIPATEALITDKGGILDRRINLDSIDPERLERLLGKKEIGIRDSSVQGAFNGLLDEIRAQNKDYLTPLTRMMMNKDITAEQMFRLIERATKDADGQAAGQEFDDLRKVIKYLVDNEYNIDPKAMEVWNGYADKAGAIRLQGHSGIPTAEYDAIMGELAKKVGIRYDPTNQPFMGKEYGIDPKNAAIMERMQQEGFGLKVGPDGKVLIEYKGLQMTSGVAQNDEKFEEKLIAQLMELERLLKPEVRPSNPLAGLTPEVQIPAVSKGGALIN
ncbi:MAG: hypothetical protein EBZ48_14485, partial [Proteobacteria bacterium]|nr:hypothetical protein [Pseudomonadota bacterium]